MLKPHRHLAMERGLQFKIPGLPVKATFKQAFSLTLKAYLTRVCVKHRKKEKRLSEQINDFKVPKQDIFLYFFF